MNYKLGHMPSLFPISKYNLVHKKNEQTDENFISLKSGPPAFRYVAYAAKLLFGGKHQVIYLSGTGQACRKVVQAVETLRNRIQGLHVAYEITATEFNDVYHPTEEGLDIITINRKIHTLRATVVLGEDSKIEHSLGYLKPSDKVLDEEGFKKKVADHYERTKEIVEKRTVDINERKKRREEKIANGETVAESLEKPAIEARDPLAPHRPKRIRNTRKPSGNETHRNYHNREKGQEIQYENKDKKQTVHLNGDALVEGVKQPRKQRRNKANRNNSKEDFTQKVENKPENDQKDKVPVKQNEKPKREQQLDKEGNPIKQEPRNVNKNNRQERQQGHVRSDQPIGHRDNRNENRDNRNDNRDNKPVYRNDNRPDYRNVNRPVYRNDNRPDYRNDNRDNRPDNRANRPDNRDNRPDNRDNRPDYRDNRNHNRDNRTDVRDNRPQYDDNQRENREYQPRNAPVQRENVRYRDDYYNAGDERRPNNYRNDRPNYRNSNTDIQRARPIGGRPYYRDNEGKQTNNNYGPNRSDSRGRNWRNQASERDEETRKPSNGGNFRGDIDQPFKLTKEEPKNYQTGTEKEHVPSQNRFRERNA